MKSRSTSRIVICSLFAIKNLIIHYLPQPLHHVCRGPSEPGDGGDVDGLPRFWQICQLYSNHGTRGADYTHYITILLPPPGYLELPTALVRMLPAWLNCTKNFSTSEKSNYLCGNLIFCFSMIRNQHIFFISLFFILYPPRLLIWPVANHNKVEALCSARVRG